MPFKPGNIRGHGRGGSGVGWGVGLSKNIKHDDNMEVDEVTLKENTTYNEYCATQGLVHYHRPAKTRRYT